MFTMDMEQHVNDGRLEADHGRYIGMTRKLRYFRIKGTRMSPTIRFRMSVMGQICQIHNEKTGYFRRSLSMGLVQGGTKGSDIR